MSSQDGDEFEVSFLYSVESSQPSYEYIDDLEDWILYYVANKTALSCAGVDGGTSYVLPAGREGKSRAGVIKVRYPEDGESTSIRGSCDQVSSIVKACAIWRTKLVITSVGLSVADIHRDALMTIRDAFEDGTFLRGIPGLIDISYLGPHPDALTIETPEDNPANEAAATMLRLIPVFSTTAAVIAVLI